MKHSFSAFAISALFAIVFAVKASAATITYTGNVVLDGDQIVVRFPAVRDFATFNFSVQASADFGCTIASPRIPPGEPGFCPDKAVQGFMDMSGGFETFVGQRQISFDNDPFTSFRESSAQGGFAVVNADNNIVTIDVRIFAFASDQLDFPVTVALLMTLSDPNLGDPEFLRGSLVRDDPDQIPLPASLPLLAGALSCFGLVRRRNRIAAMFKQLIVQPLSKHEVMEARRLGLTTQPDHIA